MKWLKKYWGITLYLSLFIASIFLSVHFAPKSDDNLSSKPIEIKHSPEEGAALYDYYQTQQGIDKYWESELQKRDERILELEKHLTPTPTNPFR